jgi:hypothetical protein
MADEPFPALEGEFLAPRRRIQHAHPPIEISRNGEVPAIGTERGPMNIAAELVGGHNRLSPGKVPYSHHVRDILLLG